MEFETIEHAKTARSMYHGQWLDDSQVYIQFASVKQGKETHNSIKDCVPNCQLIVRNLSFDLDHDRLEKVFSKATSVNILKDKKTKNSRG